VGFGYLGLRALCLTSAVLCCAVRVEASQLWSATEALTAKANIASAELPAKVWKM